MNVICDVHLSIKLTKFLVSCGINAIHANQLPGRSETPDAEISAFANANDYVVFTKDGDFRNSYLLRRSPRKLVHICTGNQLKDRELIELIKKHLDEIQRLYENKTFYLEITATQLTAIITA